MPGAATDVEAVKYSPNFTIDQALLFITEEPAAGPTQATIALHFYSYEYLEVDPFGFNSPRALFTGAGGSGVTSLNAVIVLDETFTLYDNETGFIVPR
jgi:hypothetical protein